MLIICASDILFPEVFIMVDTNDFNVGDEFKKQSDSSSNYRSSKKRNIDASKMNDFSKEARKRAQEAIKTGNTRGLENLVEDASSDNLFSDKRNNLQKIKDTILFYVNSIQKKEYLIKSGQYQAIEEQIKDLSSKNTQVEKYRSMNNSAKSDLIVLVGDYARDVRLMVNDISADQESLNHLKSIFTVDAIDLIDGYFSGDVSEQELINLGLDVDIESLQHQREGIYQITDLEASIERKKHSLNVLQTEYGIASDKKQSVEFDLIDLDMQELFNNALINQLKVDLKLSSRPSVSSLFANLRISRDSAHDVSNKVLENEQKQRSQYNVAAESAGYDSNFRKAYSRNQKNRSKFKL